MEKKFDVLSSITTTRYGYTDGEIAVEGNYQVDAESGQFQRVEGNCNEPSEEEGKKGAYIGNFTGVMENGTIIYTFSPKISMENLKKMQAAIEEIEKEIFSNN